jgi:FSR family fosmidomycin resistance protein-like MFS transporter
MIPRVNRLSGLQYIVSLLKQGYNHTISLLERLPDMSLFRNQIYLAVTLGHFTIDTFASMGPVLVTFFSVSLGLSAAQIGLAIGAFQLTGAATQPLFGWLTDKVGSRWLGPASVAWTLSFLAVSVLLLQQTESFIPFLIPFGLAALGVGAFHPQGAMHAGTSIKNREATATAVFFFCGQTGLATGPFLAGLVLDNIGASGVYLIAFLALPLPLFMAHAMRYVAGHAAPVLQRAADQGTATASSARWGAVVLWITMVGFRSWAYLGTVAFLPKIFQTLGWNATSYGLITGTFWLASGISGVIAGTYADRLGRRQVVFVTTLIGSIAVYFLPLNQGLLAFPVAMLAGGLLGASHSILVVMFQALLPHRKALASGMALGYIFGIGALAAWGNGLLADSWGLIPVIQAGAGLGLIGALLALLLPSTRQVARSQAEQALA